MLNVLMSCLVDDLTRLISGLHEMMMSRMCYWANAGICQPRLRKNVNSMIFNDRTSVHEFHV